MPILPNITVVMSTYNGEKYIRKQLDSILCQKDVHLNLFVRDDGSRDGTVDVVKEYQNKNPNVFLWEGENVGWERSFLLALKKAPSADYYAFADQDDIWFENKLNSAIKKIEESGSKGPVLFHCNKISVDGTLRPLPNQVKRIKKPLNRKNALIQEYAQGCSIVINKNAYNLINRFMPREKIAHDFWCGLLCFLFGDIVYDDTAYFYHISHSTNASGEGHKWRSRFSRLKSFFSKKNVYRLPIDDLLEGYGNMLALEDRSFVQNIQNYKKNWASKWRLLFSCEFIRVSFLGTLLLKISILTNRL